MRVSAVILTVTWVACVFANEGYNINYGNINIDELLSRPRAMIAYLNCLRGVGPCTPEGRESKKYFPEVLKSNCAKCSEEQINITKKMVKAFYTKFRDDWTKLMDKYDPKHELEESFIKWANEEK